MRKVTSTIFVWVLLGIFARAYAEVSWKVLAYYGGGDNASNPAEVVALAAKEETWVSPDTVKDYTVAAILPNISNYFWMGVTYGVVNEGGRLGLELNLFPERELEIASRENIRRIIQQIRKPFNGLIVAGLDYPAGSDQIVAEVTEQGVPAIEIMKGREPTRALAKVEIPPYRRGYVLASYVARQLAGKSEPADIIILAGPAGSDWAAYFAEGFKRTIEKFAPGKVRILEERWGDLDKYVQLELVESALAAFKHIDYLVCNAVAAEVAPAAIEAAGRTNEVKVLSAYMTPTVWKEVAFGKVAAALVDFPVLQGRLAVDILTMLLEGKQAGRDVPSYVWPKLAVITPDSYPAFSSDWVFPPQHWQPPLSSNPATITTVGR